MLVSDGEECKTHGKGNHTLCRPFLFITRLNLISFRIKFKKLNYENDFYIISLPATRKHGVDKSNRMVNLRYKGFSSFK